MSKLLKRVVALILVLILTSANLIILGEYTLSLALSDDELNNQDVITNNKNIEFNSYFYGDTHIQTFSVNSEDAKIYIRLGVKNEGYLENSTIEFQNANFKLKEGIQNENIQNIDIKNNRITLNKLNNGSDVTIELPIEINRNETVPSDYFTKESLTKFTGTYIDGEGKERSVEKEVTNKLLWEGEAEAELSVVPTKFVPYATNGNYGVMVQVRVNSNIKDSALPIKTTNIELTVPSINNVKPTSVNVIATKTEATNGKTDGLDFTNGNFSYDAENGKVIINTSNTESNISWKNGVSDEYLVTYIFEGREIYDYANENGIDSSVAANSNITVYNNIEENMTSIATTAIKYEEKEGTVTDFALAAQTEISKGYLYANYEAKDKMETEYTTKYTAIVNNAKITTSLEFAQAYDRFLAEEGPERPTTINGNNYAYNKRIEISQAIFNKMLGQDGEIIVKDTTGTELGKINKDTTTENGSYILDVSDKNNNQLIITTTTPIIEGQLELTVVKALKGEIGYSINDMANFEKMKVAFEGKTNTTTFETSSEILLKEPETKVELEINKSDLTTVVPNQNVEIRAVLDTSNQYNALFENPTFKITLPKAVEEVKLKSSNILLANGLKIKSAKTAEEKGRKVINVEIEGAQTEYALNADYKGAIVVLNTDLTLDTLTPSGDDKIKMEYKNNNENATKTDGTLNETVNYVAPNGVVAANGISNYKEGAEDILSMSDEAKTAEIEAYAEKRVATMNGIIINNYSNDIGNIVVLGRLPSQGNKRIDTDEDLGSTFNIPLSAQLTLDGIEAEKYTVYYSDNSNATSDLEDINNNWKEEATTNSKSFLIVFAEDYKMPEGTRIDFTYDIEIPGDIDPNNASYGMYKVYYNNESEIGAMPESKESAVIGIKTEAGPQLSAEISANIDTVKEGQVVKMTATVKNTGNQTANNVRVKIPVPHYMMFVEYRQNSNFVTLQDETITKEIGNIEPNEGRKVTYYLRVEDSAIKDYTSSDEDAVSPDFPKDVEHSLEILTDDLKNPIPSSTYTMKIYDGSIKIDMIPSIADDAVLKNGDQIKFTISLFNILNLEEINNTVAKIELPKALEYTSASIKNLLDDKESITDGITFEEATNTLTFNLGTLERAKYILLETKVVDDTGNIRMLVTAKGDGTEENYSNVFEHNVEPVNLKVSELTSTPKYVKERENITYKFSVTNAGNSKATNIRIVDQIPEGISEVKANYTYDGDTATVSKIEDGKLTIEINWLDPKETTKVEIIATADYLSDKNDKEIRNKILIQSDSMEDIETNEVVNYIEYNSEINHPGEGSDAPGQAENRYRITGTAWIDSNQDGKRDDEEETVSGVQVYLLNQKQNSIVQDVDTNEEKVTTTSENGRYEFTNLVPGQYVVVFVYDSSRYSLTEYQVEGVDTSLNSDAIDINITLDGERRLAAITDTIEITDENARDIDIGMYEAEKFDLRLDKYISKVTLSTPTIGTRVDEHNNLQVAQVEVLGQNLGKSTAVVEYTIRITNEGSVSGYVRNIVDYLPDEFTFSTDLNSDWYLSDNGNIYNASLENTKIEPGETKDIKLIVSVNINEANLGIISNTAEIYETYNEQGLKDIDSEEANKATNEDDMSKADLVLGLVTGKMIGYTILALVVIAILGFGILEIKKHVLNKKV